MTPICHGDATDSGVTVRERMSIAISRDLADGEVVLTGAASAIPLAACLLAQARHAPSLTILGAGVYINPRRLVPEFTAGWDCDPVAIADMSDVFSLTELGIDVMFYGGMQIDRYGSVNLHTSRRRTACCAGPAGELRPGAHGRADDPLHRTARPADAGRSRRLRVGDRPGLARAFTRRTRPAQRRAQRAIHAGCAVPPGPRRDVRPGAGDGLRRVG